MGRKATYGPQVWEQVLQAISRGESLHQIAKKSGMPAASSVVAHAQDDAAFGERYARERDKALDLMALRLLEIAGDKTRDANCRRVEVDALKWYLCKLAPKRYGDRLQVAGDKEEPLTVRVIRCDQEP